ncbi:MAG TPA: histidine--tRNA ligase [Gemmatimonadaceae bacterium]|jgi:histidyl-tRNA synthetase
MQTSALPGFREFYPEQLSERTYILRVWRDVMRRYGFAEYDGPPLEPLDLYRKKSGDELVGQLYSFRDKGDRDVALRPEMTPTFARMVAARANALRKPVRWYSVPQLFRYERQQKGRLREHFQLNADIVGEPGVAADAELLAAALDVMRSLGLTSRDVVARVSDRRLLQALLAGAGVADKDLASVFGIIDKLGRDSGAAATERFTEAIGNDAVARRVLKIVRLSDLHLAAEAYGAVPGVEENLSRLREYFARIEALGFADWVRLDLSIVRGLAYYTGIVFELFDEAGEYRAICGGGRYDDLLRTLGGVDLPALGFGMGDVVLGELLRSRGLMRGDEARLDFWLVADDDSLSMELLSIASRLRSKGWSVEYALKPQALARQLKTASQIGAKRAVILKSNERDKVTVRDLEKGTEQSHSIDDFINSLNERNG